MEITIEVGERRNESYCRVTKLEWSSTVCLDLFLQPQKQGGPLVLVVGVLKAILLVIRLKCIIFGVAVMGEKVEMSKYNQMRPDCS